MPLAEFVQAEGTTCGFPGSTHGEASGSPGWALRNGHLNEGNGVERFALHMENPLQHHAMTDWTETCLILQSVY